MKKHFITKMITRSGLAIAVVALGLFGYSQSVSGSGKQSDVTLDKLIHVANANAEGSINCSGLTSGCTSLANIGGVIVSGTIEGYKN